MVKIHITDSNFDIKFHVWRIFIKPLRAMSAVGGQTIPSLVTFMASEESLLNPSDDGYILWILTFRSNSTSEGSRLSEQCQQWDNSKFGHFFRLAHLHSPENNFEMEVSEI